MNWTLALTAVLLVGALPLVAQGPSRELIPPNNSRVRIILTPEIGERLSGYDGGWLTGRASYNRGPCVGVSPDSVRVPIGSGGQWAFGMTAMSPERSLGIRLSPAELDSIEISSIYHARFTKVSEPLRIYAPGKPTEDEQWIPVPLAAVLAQCDRDTVPQ